MNEIEIIGEVLRYDRSGDRTMIDVGAHFGNACLPFGQSGWTVHAFEPDPNNRIHLIEQVGTLANVTIDPRAVSDAPATDRPWFSSEESTGISGLSAFRESHVESTSVTAIDLAAYCEEQNISRIELLKIDAEGFDFMVLRGHDWSTPDRHPRAILCEFEDSKTVPLGYRWIDMANFLSEKGYGVIVSEWKPIVRYGIEHQWRKFHPFPCSLDDDQAWGNLIAVRDQADWKPMLKACRRREADYHRERSALRWMRLRIGLSRIKAACRKVQRLAGK